MEEKIVFWGATGQAKVLRECIRHRNFKIMALFDNDTGVKSPFVDVPLYYGMQGFENWYKREYAGDVYFLVAIGGFRGKDRMQLFTYLKNKALVATKAIHITAFVADDAVIGEGSQILANSAVCAAARIGCGCIINTGATVDHDCKIDDGVHICPGATIAGEVRIDRFASVGAGAVVLPGLKIGEGAIIGAGAVVLKDVSPYCIMAGNPARLLRRLPDE